MKLDRREFIGKFAVVAGGLIFPRLQTPEQTPEADPFAQIDVANIELINTQIANAESDILGQREASEEEFRLEAPRLAALGKLDIRPMAPDVGFGVLATTDGTPYALIYNHDMGCVRKPLDEAGLLGQTLIFKGPAGGTIFDPGVAEIQITPVDPSLRLESMMVQRFLDKYRVKINGVEMTLPVLVVKGFEMGGVAYDCPTIVERVGGRAEDIVRQVQQGLSNFEFEEKLESAGEVIGSVLGNLAQGTARGVRDAFDD